MQERDNILLLCDLKQNKNIIFLWPYLFNIKGWTLLPNYEFVFCSIVLYVILTAFSILAQLCHMSCTEVLMQMKECLKLGTHE